jgi:Tol biopolymer transport system component
MTTVDDERIRAFLADEAQRALVAAPALEEAIGRLAPRVGAQPSADSRRWIVLLAATLLLVAALGTAIAVGSGILRLGPEEPSLDLGIFAPVAGRIVYGDDEGLWGLDPTASADGSSRVQLSSGTGTPLGWSRDGTRLLIVRQSGALQDPGRLVVLHADGSETQVAERPTAIWDATLAPDGSRVVFADGSALYMVDAFGGPAEMLLGPGEHLVQRPTFSPDGTRIAYAIGGGDHSNDVWVMDADGSNAHQLVSNAWTEAPGHVRGLAWSPAGDRIALGLEGRIYTFASDGSDFTLIAGVETSCNATGPCAVTLPESVDSPYWSPDGSQIAYTTGCVEGAGSANRGGCRLAIADADGSNVREFSDGASGPWHPGPLPERPEAANGWIAFTVSQEPSGARPDTDIWFVRIGEEPRRVLGTESDEINQLCPAFAPDGRSLAYGSVANEGSDQDDAAQRPPYKNSALVIADVADDGTVSDRLAIDVGDGLPPPCPVWSPDGSQVAFGVPRTSPINPDTSAEGSQVWLVTLADSRITILDDLLATDLEWSPHGDLLALASGVNERVDGNVLHDGRIYLYEPSSGEMRSLASTLGATSFTWSPDGRRIAYATIANAPGDAENELRVVDLDSGEDELLAARYGVLHGIGPVWSPDGETIVYQRTIGTGERHEVVLVSPDAISDDTGLPSEVVVPTFHRTARGDENLYPYWVTWSPDSEYLLYEAWGEGAALSGIVAVPTDPDKSAVALAVDVNFVPYDGYPDTATVPIQTWGREQGD